MSENDSHQAHHGPPDTDFEPAEPTAAGSGDARPQTHPEATTAAGDSAEMPSGWRESGPTDDGSVHAGRPAFAGRDDDPIRLVIETVDQIPWAFFWFMLSALFLLLTFRY